MVGTARLDQGRGAPASRVARGWRFRPAPKLRNQFRQPEADTTPGRPTDQEIGSNNPKLQTANNAALQAFPLLYPEASTGYKPALRLG